MTITQTVDSGVARVEINVSVGFGGRQHPPPPKLSTFFFIFFWGGGGVCVSLFYIKFEFQF